MMNKLFSLPIFVSILFAVFSLNTARAVDVYVGFMDEEVNGVLKSLVEKNPGRRVIVVERTTDFKGGNLFGRSVESYGGAVQL